MGLFSSIGSMFQNAGSRFASTAVGAGLQSALSPIGNLAGRAWNGVTGGAQALYNNLNRSYGGAGFLPGSHLPSQQYLTALHPYFGTQSGRTYSPNSQMSLFNRFPGASMSASPWAAFSNQQSYMSPSRHQAFGQYYGSSANFNASNMPSYVGADNLGDYASSFFNRQPYPIQQTAQYNAGQSWASNYAGAVRQWNGY